MERDFPAFCHRQSAKMLEFAKDCTDQALEDEFLQMSVTWLKMASASSTKQSSV